MDAKKALEDANEEEEKDAGKKKAKKVEDADPVAEEFDDDTV